MTAYIYLRVSTDEQGVSGLGLNAQRTSCLSIAERLGASQTVEMSDVGISGASEIIKRPGLTHVLQNVKKGDVLIVAKRDRIAREPRLIGSVEYLLKKRKVDLVSAAGEGTGESGAAGLMQRGMFDLFAQIEREMTRERVTAALADKMSRNERTGTIPFGHTIAKDGQHVIEKTTGKRKCIGRDCEGCLNIIPFEPEQTVIHTVSTLSSSLSTRAIAEHLNISQIKSRTGNPWTKTQIIRILHRLQSQSLQEK